MNPSSNSQNNIATLAPGGGGVDRLTDQSAGSNHLSYIFIPRNHRCRQKGEQVRFQDNGGTFGFQFNFNDFYSERAEIFAGAG